MCFGGSVLFWLEGQFNWNDVYGKENIFYVTIIHRSYSVKPSYIICIIKSIRSYNPVYDFFDTVYPFFTLPMSRPVSTYMQVSLLLINWWNLLVK